MAIIIKKHQEVYGNIIEMKDSTIGNLFAADLNLNKT